MVISSKVAACTSQPVSSGIQYTSEHSWMSDRPKKQALVKADPSAFGNGVLLAN